MIIGEASRARYERAPEVDLGYRVSGTATPEEFAQLLEEAFGHRDELRLRSCWVCNPAHAKFLEDGQEWVLMCFACGHVYFKGTDLTEERS